ncbi:hypothetical protein [Streptomyces sp. SAS_270]|uniref:hypothetical protein n=1 Tax=Streptomyces sp. SAS_270 TaxID=3412748 RepID=UPI00403CFFD6
MIHSRLARAVLGAATSALLASALAGCGDAGALKGAGATPTAVGPTKLWPQVPPASTPALDYGEADTETVKGVTAPGDDIHKVDPVDVVRAEVAAHPDDYTGPHAVYAKTVQQLKDCSNKSKNKHQDQDQGRKSSKNCPILQAYYRDLTGDGKDDLVLGIRLPDDQLAVRVYMFLHHKLVQIMGTSDSTVSVEIAGRDVIIRSPSTLPGYEYRTVWSWDAEQDAMLATRDEILRVGTPSPSRHGTAPPTTSPAPSESAS